jgi:predicted amidohydrolase
MTQRKKSMFVMAICLAAVAAVGWSPRIDADEPVKQPAKPSQSVGVACVCMPQYTEMAVLEKEIDRAAHDKPDIIILTEHCLGNTAKTASGEEKTAAAEPLPAFGPITTFLSRKAKQHHTYILAGYYRKNPRGEGRYNSAVLLDREGRLAGCYDKVFPTVGELESGVVPGRRAVVFDTDFGRIGAMICFDLNFPELAEAYRKLDVKLMCFVSAFRGGKMLPSLALKNQWFIASAVPGENGVIVDPLGRVLAESSNYGKIACTRINLDSQVVHIDYNVERVRRMKEKYGTQVRIDTASPEAVFLLSSLHPEKSIREMIEEFGVETRDDYFDRSRRERLKRLPAVDGREGLPDAVSREVVPL